MRLLHISDTHGKHQILKDLPEADFIVHTGDITEDGTEEEVKDFIEWFSGLSYAHKIFIAGNHDNCLYGANIEGLPDNVHYLCNDSITIDGINYGDYTLYKRVMDVRPKYHLFGHLHHTEKTQEVFRRVRFSNAAGGKYGRYELLKI